MRAATWIALGLLAASLLIGATGCILDEKVIDIVFKNSTCMTFEEYHVTEEFTTPEVVDVTDDIDDALADQGLTRDDILEASLIGGSYQVTVFDHEHDWVLSGHISVRRTDISDGPDTLVVYTSQSLEAAMPAPVYAVLHGDGVALFNRALDDYLDGDHPILEFTVHNGEVEGPLGQDPSELDPLDFVWEACLRMYVIVEETYEVPDVFPG